MSDSRVKLLEQWGITSYQKTSLSFGFHDTATGFRYMVPEPWEFSVKLVKGQSRLPGSPTLAKAEGMVRFHLEGQRPLAEQGWPPALESRKDDLLSM